MENVEAPAPTPDERTIAMLAHFLQIFAWFWGPLIVYLVKRESRFVAFHALQALFLQIIFMVFWFGSFSVWMAFIFGFFVIQGDKPHNSQAPPLWLFILFPALWGLMMCGWILNITLGIIFGIKASKGEWAQYPILGRWARRLAG
jgi:uncharacterized Tic20 family protein